MNYKQQALELVAENLLPYGDETDVMIAKEISLKYLRNEYVNDDLFRQNEIVHIIEEVEKINGIIDCNSK